MRTACAGPGLTGRCPVPRRARCRAGSRARPACDRPVTVTRAEPGAPRVPAGAEPGGAVAGRSARCGRASRRSARASAAAARPVRRAAAARTSAAARRRSGALISAVSWPDRYPSARCDAPRPAPGSARPGLARRPLRRSDRMAGVRGRRTGTHVLGRRRPGGTVAIPSSTRCGAWLSSTPSLLLAGSDSEPFATMTLPGRLPPRRRSRPRLRHRPHLAPGREGGAAAAGQARLLDLGDQASAAARWQRPVPGRCAGQASAAAAAGDQP